MNDKGESASAYPNVWPAAIQDGVGLEKYYSSQLDIGDKVIRTYATLPCCEVAFFLTSDSTVIFEISPYMGKAVLSKRFTLG